MYWDANASSRLRPQGVEALREFLSWGKVFNPSSVHSEGRYARALLRRSRERILEYLGLSEADAELCFMSGGTEACNSLVYGFCPLTDNLQSPGHIITTSIEHAAMLEPVRRLQGNGYEVSFISPRNESSFLNDDFVSKIRKETCLVSLMVANNETGLLLPVPDIVASMRSAGYQGPVVCDASQAVSKSGISFSKLFAAGVDAVAVSAHKMGAMPGSGAVIFSKQTCRFYNPLVQGGPQEGKKRGGTEFVAGAYVWGVVSEYLVSEGENERAGRREARDLLFRILSDGIPDCISHTPFDSALDNTLLLQIPECRGDDLVAGLDLEGISVSTGAACSSGKQDVSHVLHAIGLSREAARECVRISLDWDISTEEVKNGARIFVSVVERMRKISIKKPGRARAEAGAVLP
jgi:cysteine desulfurase